MVKALGKLRAVGVAMFVAAVQPGSGWAAAVLDQINDPASTFLAPVHFNSFAQTFTVGVTGLLTSVEVKISREREFATGTDLLWNIRSTSLRTPLFTAGQTLVPDAPAANALASGTLTPSDVPFAPNVGAFVTLSLGGGIPVVAGDVLAIALGIPDPLAPVFSYFWYGGTNNPYPNGELFSTNVNLNDWFVSDFNFSPQFRGEVAFRTFVDTAAVPIPAALPLFASGLGVMGLLNWRRHRKRAA